MTGSGVAACAAVGGIMIPMMVKNGYHSDFACALQATSGIFGPLIPPSIVMVLYAVYANQSVSTMLMAGVGPGLMQAAMVCILAVWICPSPRLCRCWQFFYEEASERVWVFFLGSFSSSPHSGLDLLRHLYRHGGLRCCMLLFHSCRSFYL